MMKRCMVFLVIFLSFNIYAKDARKPSSVKYKKINAHKTITLTGKEGEALYNSLSVKEFVASEDGVMEKSIDLNGSVDEDSFISCLHFTKNDTYNCQIATKK